MTIEATNKKVLESLTIEDGLSSLKSAGLWPAKPVTPPPKYASAFASMYLQVVPKNVSDKFSTSSYRFIQYASEPSCYLFVKHPLSLNRKVCVILDTAKEGETIFKKELTDLGVTGEITVISSEDLRTCSIHRNDNFIIAENVFEKASKSLQSLIKPAQAVFRFSKSEKRANYRKKLHKILRRTTVIPKPDKSFMVKVGNSDLSDSAIKDNILEVLSKLNINGRFAGGWDSIKIIGIKTGKSEVVPIYKANGRKIVSPCKVVQGKRKWEKTDEGAEPTAKQRRISPFAKRRIAEAAAKAAKSLAEGKSEQAKTPSPVKIGEEQAKAGSPKLKRNSKDAVQPDSQANGSPKKKKGPEKTESPKNLNKVPISSESSEQKNQANGSPKEKKSKKEQRDNMKEEPSSEDLVQMLINRARESVFTPEQKRNKNKKNKSPKKALLTVQEDGKLSEAFKKRMVASLKEFASGTEFEDIIIEPGQDASSAEDTMVVAAERQAVNAAQVTPVGVGSPKNKNKSPKKDNMTSPAINGTVKKVQMQPVVNGTAGKKSPKKKKNKKNKSPKKDNGTSPVTNGKVNKIQVQPVLNGSAGKKSPKNKKNQKNKSPLNVTALANGSPATKAKATKVVTLESPGSKLKKKKNKNKKKSPKKPKVVAH